MKTIIGFLLVLASLNALADEWPYDSDCRRFGADSETVTLTDGAPNQVVLCQFGLFSYIEKETLRRSYGGYGTQAVRAYVDSAQEPMGEHCTMAGAHVIAGKDSRGRSYGLCEFFDGSIMEESTFSNGPRSNFNREMNSALGLGWLLDI
jgi:putative hemolysin